MVTKLTKISRFKKEYLLLLLIVLLSYALRIYGINVKIAHPDAYAFVEGAMYYGLTDVPPASKYGLYALYVAPGFTLVELLIVLYTLFFIVGWLLGIFPNLASFEAFYHSNMDYFYILARLGTVSLGVGSIIAVYYIAKKVFGSKTALLSALFLSVSFMHSMHSQFIRMDIIAIFFVLLSVYYSLVIFERRDFKSYILAGLFAGGAIASKYTSGLVIFPIFMAHILAEGRNLNEFIPSKIKANLLFFPVLTIGFALSIVRLWVDISQISQWVSKYLYSDGVLSETSLRFLEIMHSKLIFLGVGFILTALILKGIKPLNSVAVNLITNKKLIVSILSVFFSFIIFDPIFFINIGKIGWIFLNDPNFLGENTIFVGVDRLEGIKTHLWYLTNPLRWALDTHIALLGGIGLLMAAFRRRKKELILLTFPLLYFVFIGMGKFRWDRYVIPLLPFVTIYAGKFLVDSVDKISKFQLRFFQSKKGLVLIILSLILIINPIYNILRYDYLLTQTDTRTLSEQWAKHNLPLEAKIGQDHYTGNLPGDMFDITKQYSLSQGKSLDDYKNEGFEYLIISSTMYDRFFAEPQKYAENVEFYQRLFNEGKLIKTFEPDQDLWPRPAERFSKYHIHVSPTIKVYKVQ